MDARNRCGRPQNQYEAVIRAPWVIEPIATELAVARCPGAPTEFWILIVLPALAAPVVNVAPELHHPGGSTDIACGSEDVIEKRTEGHRRE
jgi:hypothetical protein